MTSLPLTKRGSSQLGLSVRTSTAAFVCITQFSHHLFLPEREGRDRQTQTGTRTGHDHTAILTQPCKWPGSGRPGRHPGPSQRPSAEPRSAQPSLRCPSLARTLRGFRRNPARWAEPELPLSRCLPCRPHPAPRLYTPTRLGCMCTWVQVCTEVLSPQSNGFPE